MTADDARERWRREVFGLEGRVALLTGATGGIGRALAHGLAGAGAALALSGRSSEELESLAEELRAGGATTTVHPADLLTRAEPDSLVTRVVETHGRIDVLVNCAGINRRRPILDFSDADYDQVMAVNLRAPFLLGRAAAGHMIRQGGGKIINIGSITVAIGLEDGSVYGMSKAALGQLTRSMAIEWGRYNIQINCLAPGFIRTELTEEPLWQNPGKRRWIMDRLSIRRPGLPDDLAGAAVFLASAASDYMTGQVLWIDGGMLAGSRWNEDSTATIERTFGL